MSSQGTQGNDRSQGQPVTYSLKNAQMTVIGYSEEPNMNIELKFILKNGDERYFSEYY